MDDSTARFILELLERRGGAYSDELITRAVQSIESAHSGAKTPAMIRKMRRIGKNSHHSEAWVFLRQGKFMENYEDDYEKHDLLLQYRPTYSDLSDGELRTYFTWRTKVRRGEIKKTDKSYAFLYIYELLNLIGTSGPEDAFEKLAHFCGEYSKLDDSLEFYTSFWLLDFTAYYALPSSFAQRAASRFSRPSSDSISLLRSYADHSDEEIFSALLALSSYNASNSRFFKEHSEDFKRAAARAYLLYDKYCSDKNGESYADKLFLIKNVSPYSMFHSAVFFDRIKRESFEYKIDEYLTYRAKGVRWYVEKIWISTGKSKDLGVFMRALDSLMRKKYFYPHPTKNPCSDDAVNSAIEEAVDYILSEKRKSTLKKIEIDTSKLVSIRTAAEKTREKLTEYEESELEDEEKEANAPAGGSLLTKDEREFLHSLLYGEAYTPPKGVMLSILAESVNEKLFDTFSDNVIDFASDTPYVFEDYEEDLKGLVTA